MYFNVVLQTLKRVFAGSGRFSHSLSHIIILFVHFSGWLKSYALSLVHNMTLVQASRRERRERRERQFVNYPASVSVGERWLMLE